jgi:PEP-CTERM motif
MNRIALVAAVTATLAAATAANATTQLVTNGDFTNLTSGLGELGFNTNAVGWSSTGYNFVMTVADQGSVGSYGKVTLWDAANGGSSSWNGLANGPGNFVALNGDFHTGPLTQTITGLTAGDTYHLSFSYAFAQQNHYSGATMQSLTETLGSQAFTSPSVDVPSHGFSGWQTFNTTIVASASSETLSFLAAGTPQVPPFALVSNVSLTGVPEPAAWTLLIVGVGLVGGASRRRRADVTLTA